MRIIHTSDWHLGQNFMGKIREAEHAAFLAWLLEMVDHYQVDALIVAGDIFDTGTPPSYARKLYNNFIVSLQGTCCSKMVVVGGNHDSVTTLHEAKELLACLNTVVCGSASGKPDEQVLVLKDPDGNPGAILCAVPFIRQRDVLKSSAGQTGQDRQQSMARAISDYYGAVYEQAVIIRDRISKDAPLPIIATGHLTTVGGRVSESVRDIYIGSLDAFPVSGFPPVDYLALGHLHQEQAVKGYDHIRYSGSPIALSFGEAQKDKQVLLVELEPAGLQKIQPIKIPCFQKLCQIRGTLRQVESKIASLPDPEPGKTIWLEIEVVSDDYLDHLQTRVLEMIGDRAVELLRIRRDRKTGSGNRYEHTSEKLEELNVTEVFLRRLTSEEPDSDTHKALLAAFSEIVYHIEVGDDTVETGDVG